MGSNTAIFIIAVVSFVSLLAVLNDANETKRDITNGVVKVQGTKYHCEAKK